MKLESLIPRIKDMSEDELREHVRRIRHNKFTVRPAAVTHRKKEARKEDIKLSKSLTTTVAGMSDADKARLLQLLEEGESGEESAEDGTD